MKDFYVQLMSNASTVEFPDNNANSFKNRLPSPLQFREPGWKVGLANLSLPEAPRRMKLNDPFLFRIQWVELVDPQTGIYYESHVDVTETDFPSPPKNGTEFFNAVRDRYLWTMNEQTVYDLQFHKKDDPTQLTYLVMKRAVNGEGIIDNSHTCTTIKVNDSPRYPMLSIGLELAKAMQWVRSGELEGGQMGYVLGPNLRKEFPNNTIPKAVDIIVPVNNGDEIFYKVTRDSLQLSVFIDWVFTDLDGSFERAFGNNQRPFYLYSGVGQSTVTGNQVTDLLREIPHDPSKMSYEPKHILYLPVRVDVMDIIETQVAENDGSLVNFASGVTTVTLHFKYE